VYGTWYQGGFATDNIIAANTIAHNGRNGVLVWESDSNTINADRNSITQNSIYNNTLLGIDLDDDGVTLNDGGDPDFRANEDLNFPVITSAVYSGGQTTVSGTLDIDTDPTQAIVEIFKANPDPTGYGEGQTFINLTNPVASGNWSIAVTGLAIGDTITATTTDMNFNTSEFCQNYIVVTGIEENKMATAPEFYDLTSGRPNPFTHAISINYSVPDRVHVDLSIFDISGRLVRTLVSADRMPGSYTVHWDGVDADGNSMSSGVYLCLLKAGKFSTVRKIVLTR